MPKGKDVEGRFMNFYNAVMVIATTSQIALLITLHDARTRLKWWQKRAMQLESIVK